MTALLDLSKNEGRSDGSAVSSYPDTTELRFAIARRHGVSTSQVLVTAGGDDAIFRCILANIGNPVVASTPSFEMISRYASQVGSPLVEIPWWTGDFPIDDYLERIDESALGIVVSPNNPTGATIDAPALRKVAGSVRLLLLDSAYVEFAAEDLTEIALELDNVVVVRTFSKALALAGLRVGYLLGPAREIERLAAYGHPYPVAGPSLATAAVALAEDDFAIRVEAVRANRQVLTGLLDDLGARPLQSEANFVLATDVDPDWVVSKARELGVELRSFPGRPNLERCVRITVPAEPEAFDRLTRVLSTVLDPEALLFDMDGVLVDVSSSYRQAIVETAASFGVMVTGEDIEAAKESGNANDDWELTRRLCASRGVDRPIDEVASRFEAIYAPLKRFEVPLIDKQTLEEWRRDYRLGVVTGRPRTDAEEFLKRSGLADCFDAVVTREDAPFKPSPEPVVLALQQLGATRAWMVGDTVDDVEAARGAGVVPILGGIDDLKEALR